MDLTDMTLERRQADRSALVFGLALFILGMMMLVPQPASAARIKDIADVQGVRENQLIGYGLVMGLDNTGDFGQAQLTHQTLASMLTRQNIRVDPQLFIQNRNVAPVMVTARLPPMSKPGQKIDVTISAIGNARSLRGGQLIRTPLRGADGRVYVLAEGSLSTGGFAVQGNSGNLQVKNHLNVGRIPGGGIVEREIVVDFVGREVVRLNLREADFTTAVNVAVAISEKFKEPEEPAEKPADAEAPADGEAEPPADEGAGDGAQEALEEAAKEIEKLLPTLGIAKAVDAATVSVDVPEEFKGNVPQFIAFIEQLEVARDSAARVVINERTGTVVMGAQVRIKEIAVAHGNLNVSVSTQFSASQPAAFRGNGETVVLPDEQVNASEEASKLYVVKEGATITEVVGALNAVGVTPRDLIAILQAIKEAGALDAELVIQ